MKPNTIDWAQWDHLLGTKSDSLVAHDIGCSAVAVFQRRKKLGVAPSGTRYRRARIDWAQWDHLLGQVSDSDLARLIGCSTVAVWKRRHSRAVAGPRRPGKALGVG